MSSTCLPLLSSPTTTKGVSAIPLPPCLSTFIIHQQQQGLSNSSAEDLLQRFICGNNSNNKTREEAAGEDKDVELSLGLSLNGRFGVNKLTRSSSIPDFTHPTPENDASFMVTTNLARTCSMPTETEEEWKRRKEMQTLRRLEAKRKRSEKQKNLKARKDRSNSGLSEEINCQELKRAKGSDGKNFNGFLSSGVESPLPLGKVSPPLSQGSIGSQGSGSSGISEVDGQQIQVQGINKCAEARSPLSAQSSSEFEQKLAATPGLTIMQQSGSPVEGTAEGNQSCKPAMASDGSKEILVRNILEDMPCVSTTGDGPDGRKVEGFLYTYRRGGEVRIVCVCHGSFFSPAEFVKHAGGGDVAEPLKHIVVSPSPFS